MSDVGKFHPDASIAHKTQRNIDIELTMTPSELIMGGEERMCWLCTDNRTLNFTLLPLLLWIIQNKYGTILRQMETTFNQ